MKRDAKKGSILAVRQIEPQAPLVVVTLAGPVHLTAFQAVPQHFIFVLNGADTFYFHRRKSLGGRYTLCRRNNLYFTGHQDPEIKFFLKLGAAASSPPG